MEEDAEDEAEISEAAAREEILSGAARGEKQAWAALMKELWGYLEKVIRDAARGDPEALETLINDPWLYVIFCRIAEWAERKYHFSHDEEGHDIPHVLTETVREKITSVKNRNNVSWRAVLRCWLFSVAGNHCLNYLDRGRRAEERYWGDLAYENTRCRWNRKDVPEPSGAEKLEEECAEKEREEARQDALRKSQAAEIKKTVWRVFDSLTEEQKRFTRLWAVKKMTYEKIADEAKVSKQTVCRRLTEVFRLFIEELEELIEEFGRTEGKKVDAPKVLKHLTEHRSGELRQLIAACLQSPSGFGQPLYASL
jgi:RNA polymerase sigma factor (sigma-70 family)